MLMPYCALYEEVYVTAMPFGEERWCEQVRVLIQREIVGYIHEVAIGRKGGRPEWWWLWVLPVLEH